MALIVAFSIDIEAHVDHCPVAQVACCPFVEVRNRVILCINVYTRQAESGCLLFPVYTIPNLTSIVKFPLKYLMSRNVLLLGIANVSPLPGGQDGSLQEPNACTIGATGMGGSVECKDGLVVAYKL